MKCPATLATNPATPFIARLTTLAHNHSVEAFPRLENLRPITDHRKIINSRFPVRFVRRRPTKRRSIKSTADKVK